ncbi:histone-like nucleoid-structuring protein Lsr2 [Streptomyces sp. NPDC057681]|uniref:Lsr2 family DNA-binding protein n=1 Tax=Streptomyces sp. NPDC057681 TaxID=3346209 RepID=UPI0036753E45
MSGMPLHEAGDVRLAWGRVTGWLEQHAPGVFAALGGPGSSTAISGAEMRMGLKLPTEMRQWLLANDVDAGRQPDAQSCLVALGCQGVLPSGGLLLGLTDIERVYLHRVAMEEMEPSGDPDYPSWRREWVPISAERDGFYGKFLDTRTGSVGFWTEGSFPKDDEYPSLSAFFQDVADQLGGAASGNAGETAGRRMPDRSSEGEAIRLWARANGYLVNDQGRIPATIREAYEASL